MKWIAKAKQTAAIWFYLQIAEGGGGGGWFPFGVP